MAFRRARWGIWVAAVSAGALASSSGWVLERREADGLVLESRPGGGSDFRELRVHASSPLSPTELLERAWARHPDSVEGRLAERADVLEETPTERLVYVRLRLPAVARRDYTMRYRRSVDRATGVASLDFELDNRAGPAPQPGVVRMTLVHGRWVFTPRPRGGSEVLYRVLSDPAGDVPAWLAGGEQKSIALQMVREVLAPPRAETAGRAPVRR